MNEPTGTALVVKALASPEWDQKFTNALPTHVEKRRFISTAISAIRNFKEAAECDRESLYSAVLQAAQSGMMPDGKQGAIVSFRQKLPSGAYQKIARFMPMVEGIIGELGRAGITAYAVSVYEKDHLELWNDDSGQHVKHTPVVFGDRGPRMGALACARIENGATYVEVMNSEDLAKVRAVSRSKDKDGNPVGPWKDWPERMEQKSVLHRLAKRLPKSIELPPDPEMEPIEAEPTPAQTPPEPKKRPKALQAVLDQAPEEGEVPFEAPAEQDLDPAF
jgi:recombination protein RecT